MASNTSSATSGAVVTAERLGKVLMISERRVQQLVAESVLVKEGRGKYPLIANIQHYIKYWQDRAVGSNEGGEIDYHTERARLTKSQADGQEIKNAVLRRELAPVAVIEWVLNRVGSQVSSLLDAVPLKVKRRIPKMSAPEVDLIRREIVTCQNACSKIAVDLDEYSDQLLRD